MSTQCAEVLHPCGDDDDEPCFCPFIGPRRRRYMVRPSAQFVAQMRALGDRRYPLSLAEESS